MKYATSVAQLLVLVSLMPDALGAPSQHLDTLRTASVYSLNSAGLPSERALPLAAFHALKGTLSVETISLTAQGATAAGQLYLAALACHAGARRVGEAMIAKLDERTAVLSAAGGTLVYRNIKSLAEPGSIQNPCPSAPIPAGE